MKRGLIILALLTLLVSGMSPQKRLQEQVNTNPPAEPIRLIFIHHSTGGNWLADSSSNELGGDLGQALMMNNYYVSATNYGWGPDSIGDATDIPNWLDWFRGERSAVYLEALYNEDGQNFGDFGAWPRLDVAPEGENRIIVFKSCFPNSELEGSPDDEAAPDGWLTVSNAKYVYNEILKYFATRPDKLFVVITAPPLSSSPNAKNARAFNLWLVNDWLKENNYTLNNVAVFDFYNVLTGPDNHHWVNDGLIEHTYVEGRNLEYYPSGDDHPSRAGNRKATDEFVPMLNAFYNRWIATAPDSAPATQTETQGEPVATEALMQAQTGGFSESFESDTEGWEAYNDEGGSTRLDCAASSDKSFGGTQSLKLDFDVAQDGWATCGITFESVQDWSSSQGLSFAALVNAPGTVLHVDVYAADGEERESYYFALSSSDASDEWTTVQIPWSEFKRVDWEENAGQPFTAADQVTGIAFGIPSQGEGMLWVDEIQLLGDESAVVNEEVATLAPQGEETTEEAPQGRFKLPICGSAFVLPLLAFGMALLIKRKIL